MAGSLLASRLLRERCLLKQSYPWILQSLKPVGTASDKEDTFWAKNKRLNRPVSPHLSIYKPQMTWMMSLTHRTTGLILSGMVTTFAIGTLMLPGQFPMYVDLIQAQHLPGALIFLGKCSLAFPLVFHYCSGIRHLVWDMGIGYNLKTLYQSAYAVIALSGLVTLALASL